MDRVDDGEPSRTRSSSDGGRTTTHALTRRRGASVVDDPGDSGELSGNGWTREDQRGSGISTAASIELEVVGDEVAAQWQRGGAPRRSWSRRAPRLCFYAPGGD